MSDMLVRIIAKENAVKKGHMDMICDVTHHDMIYGKIERITGNKNIATDVVDWCGSAKPDEIYEIDDARIIIEKRK